MAEGRLISMSELEAIVVKAEDTMRDTAGIRSFEASLKAVDARRDLQMAAEIRRLWKIETRIKQQIHDTEENIGHLMEQYKVAEAENKTVLAGDLGSILTTMALELNLLKRLLSGKD